MRYDGHAFRSPKDNCNHIILNNLHHWRPRSFTRRLLNSFSLFPTFTSKMVEDRMEGVLLKHTAQIETTTTELLADQNARLDPLIRRPPKVHRQPRSQNSKSLKRKNTTSKTEGVAINVSQYAPACPTTCVCSCHTQVKAPAPACINRVLGQLFVGAAGVPFLSTKCDYQACKSSLAPRVTVEYWFQLHVFWSQMGPPFYRLSGSL